MFIKLIRGCITAIDIKMCNSVHQMYSQSFMTDVLKIRYTSSQSYSLVYKLNIGSSKSLHTLSTEWREKTSCLKHFSKTTSI